MGLAREQLRVGQLAKLLRRRLDEFLLTVAESRAPKPGHPLDVLLAVVVPEIDPFGMRVNGRSGLVEVGEIRRRMQHVRQVARFDRAWLELVVERIGHEEIPGGRKAGAAMLQDRQSGY